MGGLSILVPGRVQEQERNKPVKTSKVESRRRIFCVSVQHLGLLLWVLLHVWEHGGIARDETVLNSITWWFNLCIAPLGFALAGWLIARPGGKPVWIYPVAVVLSWFLAPALAAVAEFGWWVFRSFLLKRSLFGWLYYLANLVIFAVVLFVGKRRRRIRTAGPVHTATGSAPSTGC